ncbi:MAG: polysaccharide biosynthesis protein [Acidimicrobiales bacterium]
MPVRILPVLQIATDAAAWWVGLAFAMTMRYDINPDRILDLGLVAIGLLTCTVHLVIGALEGLYRRRWSFGSFEEVAGVARATVVTTAVVFVVNFVTGPARWVPASVPLGGGLAALMLMVASRYTWRLSIDRRRRPSGERAARMLVFGAGEGAAGVIKAILRDPDSSVVPVAILDDDIAKKRLSLMGIRVVGDRHAMAEAAKQFRASVLLIAIPSASAALVREIAALGREAGLEVKVLPSIGELIGGRVAVGDIRTPTMADLLGRREIDTDLAAIAGYLTGRRVLVTGAGGSIGSELCRQIARFDPAELFMLDRDESALHGVCLALHARATMESPSLVLADIRDAAALRDTFLRLRPEVVFHAAALKHLPLLQSFPAEAVKTNIWGTCNVLMAAEAAGVERLVNISTDKAADPISVLGYSKRIGECLIAKAALEEGSQWVSVRFGNVLGSRGSVLTTFQAQVAAGGPVTVTDPDTTRFFMTVEEAVQLVIQAAVIGQPGEALVLDMGTPVRIAEVAERIVAEAGAGIEIEYIGLRCGEKLHEVMLGRGEEDWRPKHPMVSHVHVPPIAPQDAMGLDPDVAPCDVINQMARLVESAVGQPTLSDPLTNGRAASASRGHRHRRSEDPDIAHGIVPTRFPPPR